MVSFKDLRKEASDLNIPGRGKARTRESLKILIEEFKKRPKKEFDSNLKNCIGKKTLRLEF